MHKQMSIKIYNKAYEISSSILNLSKFYYNCKYHVENLRWVRLSALVILKVIKFKQFFDGIENDSFTNDKLFIFSFINAILLFIINWQNNNT